MLRTAVRGSRGRFAQHSFRCAIGAWIMPTAVGGNECVSFFRSPCAAFVTANPRMVLQNSIDHFPCSFNRVLAGEECPVALHCVAQEPFVRRFLSRLLIGQGKLPILSDEFLTCKLDARGESDDRAG